MSARKKITSYNCEGWWRSFGPAKNTIVKTDINELTWPGFVCLGVGNASKKTVETSCNSLTGGLTPTHKEKNGEIFGRHNRGQFTVWSASDGAALQIKLEVAQDIVKRWGWL